MSTYAEFIEKYAKGLSSCIDINSLRPEQVKGEIFVIHIYKDNRGNERVFYTLENNYTDLKDEVCKRSYLWGEYCFDSEIQYLVLINKAEVKRFKEKSKIKEGNKL